MYLISSIRESKKRFSYYQCGDSYLKRDTDSLTWEVMGKQTPLAASVRDLLQLHLSKRDFSEQFEHEFERILTSGKYDDKIVETFLRAYKYKNGK